MADLVERIARAILLHEEACDVDAILATTEHAGDCPFAPDPRPYTCARCQAVGARGQARLILKTLTQAGFVIVPREPSEAMADLVERMIERGAQAMLNDIGNGDKLDMADPYRRVITVQLSSADLCGMFRAAIAAVRAFEEEERAIHVRRIAASAPLNALRAQAAADYPNIEIPILGCRGVYWSDVLKAAEAENRDA